MLLPIKTHNFLLRKVSLLIYNTLRVYALLFGKKNEKVLYILYIILKKNY